MSKEMFEGVLIVLFIAFFLGLCFYSDEESVIIEEQQTTNIIKHIPLSEIEIITKAAIRNGIRPGCDNWYILLAIRKAANGRTGREFGILHPTCYEEMKRRPHETLEIQAGWCAATIVKNRLIWDGQGDYIDFLGSKYCPIGATNDPDGLNKNWTRNVKHWKERLQNGQH